MCPRPTDNVYSFRPGADRGGPSESRQSGNSAPCSSRAAGVARFLSPALRKNLRRMSLDLIIEENPRRHLPTRQAHGLPARRPGDPWAGSNCEQIKWQWESYHSALTEVTTEI